MSRNDLKLIITIIVDDWRWHTGESRGVEPSRGSARRIFHLLIAAAVAAAAYVRLIVV